MLRQLARAAGRQRGVTGIETAIILTAFVVVASVFAFTVISTGLFSTERSKETFYGGLAEASSALKPRGPILAHKGTFSGGEETIYKLSVVLSAAVVGEPIDLTPPHTKDDSGVDPDIDATAKYVTVVSYQDANQILSDVPWTISFVGSNDGDNVLEEGENAEMTIWLLERENSVANPTDVGGISVYEGGERGITATSTALTTKQRFSILIKPPKGAVLNLQRTTPASFENVMDLR